MAIKNIAAEILEGIRSKYQLSPAEIARQLRVKDPTVVRVLNGNRGIGTDLLKRIYNAGYKEEVVAWLESPE